MYCSFNIKTDTKRKVKIMNEIEIIEVMKTYIDKILEKTKQDIDQDVETKLENFYLKEIMTFGKQKMIILIMTTKLKLLTILTNIIFAIMNPKHQNRI